MSYVFTLHEEVRPNEHFIRSLELEVLMRQVVIGWDWYLCNHAFWDMRFGEER